MAFRRFHRTRGHLLNAGARNRGGVAAPTRPKPVVLVVHGLPPAPGTPSTWRLLVQPQSQLRLVAAGLAVVPGVPGQLPGREAHGLLLLSLGWIETVCPLFQANVSTLAGN